MTSVDIKGDRWTYGCEHEFADWISGDLALFPAGCYRTPDVTIVNSNGVAAQKDLRLYGYGGELNTRPTITPEGQCVVLEEFLAMHGVTPAVNHRSNLHVHIRVPGLKDSLVHLKRLQEYVHTELPGIIDLVDPIPGWVTPAERKRHLRRKVSHHTFLPGDRWRNQLKATTVDEFFEREVVRSRQGRPQWHLQPRCCVNLRQLLQTDTVEFRHFSGTLSTGRLMTCVEWCHEFLVHAFTGRPLAELWDRFERHTTALGRPPFPDFVPFDQEREIRYRATAPDGTVPKTRIAANIRAILAGEFDEHHHPDEYRTAAEAAGVVPR